ncbi:hypothetical protein [Kitasatospora sp. NBC_00315]|uniref:LppU/SCO3897 family protein n=1 Tax=Kitasatospora sp. NBC_00315 TaxID=2975963 RepID=UPI00324DD623
MTTPQAPQNPTHPAPPEFLPTPEPAPAKKRGTSKILLRVLGVVAALVVGIVVFGYFVQDDPSLAVAGDCVHNAGTDSKPKVSIVKCTEGTAEFKVLKVVTGSDDKQCDAVEGVEAAYVEQSGGDSFVLCLGKNH